MQTQAEYPYYNFYEMINDHGNKRGKKVAMLDGEEKVNYKTLLHKVDKLAAYLASKGITRNDRVALFLRNSSEFIYSIFAVSKIGATLVPINTFLKSDELSYLLEDSNASLLIASTIYKNVIDKSIASKQCIMTLWEGELSHTDTRNIPIQEAFDTNANIGAVSSVLDDLALIIYTSGTTGKPKGAMLSYRNIFSNAESGRRTINVTSKDRAIVFLPMFHSFTFSIGVMLMLNTGGSFVIIRSITPFSNIFKEILLKRVTVFFGVPDVYNAIAKAKLPWYFMKLNRLRAFVSGAAALQQSTLEKMSEKFKRATLLEGYGLSEASPAVSMNTLQMQKAKSVGQALHGYEIKIVDEHMVELPRGTVGDIITTGDNVMLGYLNRPEATSETIVGGWLLTGDMGYMDNDGFLFIVDRKKDLIISKGINIYPREIEETLDLFDGVKVSAVIGIPDDKSGEAPIAYIELEDEIKSIDISALKRYLREHLANYKVPRQIYTIDELPKNATGKVLKRVLKNQLPG